MTNAAASGRAIVATRLRTVALVAILVVSLLAVPVAGIPAPPDDGSLALMTGGVDHTIHVKKGNGASKGTGDPGKGPARGKGKSDEKQEAAGDPDRGESGEHTPRRTATLTPDGGHSGSDHGERDRDDNDEPGRAADAPGRSGSGVADGNPGNDGKAGSDSPNERGETRRRAEPRAGPTDRAATPTQDGNPAVEAIRARASVTTGHESAERPKSGSGRAAGTGTAGDSTTVRVEVSGVNAGSRISIAVSHPETVDDEVALESITTDVRRAGGFSMNITTSRDRLPGSPAFHREDGAEVIQRIRMTHSIPNEAVADVTVTFRVAKHRLRETDTDPEEIALYRYAGGTWSALETRLVGETRTHYVLEAASPGLSEFAVGAKRSAFDLWSAGIDDAAISAGDTLHVTGRVTNIGAADGSFEATLLIDGTVVAREAVTVAREGTRQVNFEVRVDRVGTHRVFVNGHAAGTVTVGPDDRSLDDPDRPGFLGSASRQWLATVTDVVDAGFGPVAFFRTEWRTS